MVIQIWGPANPSNIRPTQAFQSICFRLITGASWYIANESLHKDFKMSTINELAKIRLKNVYTKLTNHPNLFDHNMSTLSLTGNDKCFLKRNWSKDKKNKKIMGGGVQLLYIFYEIFGTE